MEVRVRVRVIGFGFEDGVRIIVRIVVRISVRASG